MTTRKQLLNLMAKLPCECSEQTLCKFCSQIHSMISEYAIKRLVEEQEKPISIGNTTRIQDVRIKHTRRKKMSWRAKRNISNTRKRLCAKAKILGIDQQHLLSEKTLDAMLKNKGVDPDSVYVGGITK